MDGLRNSGAFPAHQQNVARREGEVPAGQGGLGGEQHAPPATGRLAEAAPGGFADQGRLVEVVHAGPPEGGIGHHEARGLDDPAGEAETGAHPEDGRGIGGDIGLVEGDFDHGGRSLADVRAGGNLARNCDT